MQRPYFYLKNLFYISSIFLIPFTSYATQPNNHVLSLIDQYIKPLHGTFQVPTPAQHTVKGIYSKGHPDFVLVKLESNNGNKVYKLYQISTKKWIDLQLDHHTVTWISSSGHPDFVRVNLESNNGREFYALYDLKSQDYLKINQDRVFIKIEIFNKLIAVQFLKSAETKFFLIKDLNSLKGSSLKWSWDNKGHNQFKIHYDVK